MVERVSGTSQQRRSKSILNHPPLRSNCTPVADLEELVLQSHIAFWLETNASTEDVCHSTALLSKSVNYRSSRRSQRSLQHVAEDAKNAVEVLEVFGGCTIGGVSLPLDTSHHLANDHEINDQWRGKKRVFANIEDPVYISTVRIT